MALAAAVTCASTCFSARSLRARDFFPKRGRTDTHLRYSISPSIRISTPKRRPLASMHVEAPEQTLADLAVSDGPLSSSVLRFVKYQGTGNDFILVDNRDSMEPKVTAEQAVKLCDRNFGIGADGVIFAMPGNNGTDYTMRILNSDGSEPEMCGNGIRCFARFIAQLEGIHEPRSFKVGTGAGLIVPKIQSDGEVRVDMGQPVLKASDVPTKLPGNEEGIVLQSEIVVDGTPWNVTCVSMGNPHCVTFSRGQNEVLDVDELDLVKIGPKFEHHTMFPARTNTEFVQVLSRSHIKMRVWERGAGETRACGTGACAAVVSAIMERRTERKCVVELSGGSLEIEWKREDNHVYMTGPAEEVFSGIIHL